VLVVLNKDIEDSIYPISLQLIRTDMIPDISGPVYKDIVKKLDTSLLEEEAEWKGRLGCVIYPFYQLGHETIPGIKPMATKIALRGVGFYYSIGGLKDMTYAFRVKVGGERTKDWLKLGGTENQRSKLDDMKVTIDVVKNEKEKKLLVPEFLVERDGDPVYPKLFKAGRNGVGAVIIGAGTGPEIILDANGNKKWDDFDWSKSFECTFIFWSEHVSSDDWDKLNLDWMHTPVQLKLRQDISFGGDKSGPHYSGRLTYMGTLKMNGSGQNANYIFRRGNDVVAEGLQKLMACLESSTQIQTIGSAMGIDQPAVGAGLYQYHLFAAHFSFEYTTKEGKKVKSIRPFGKYISPGNYYKYYFTIASPTGIGGLESEARFLLKASGSSENVPWERATEKDWIEKDAEKVDASIRIVAE
jgi:hypothetical protein